jgi:hypothetical protein
VWAISPFSGAATTPAPAAPSTPTTLAPVLTPHPVPVAGTQKGVTIISIPPAVDAGAYASLVAQTSPRATCDLEVTLPSGRQSESSGLGPATADASGQVKWTWLTGNPYQARHSHGHGRLRGCLYQSHLPVREINTGCVRLRRHPWSASRGVEPGDRFVDSGLPQARQKYIEPRPTRAS